MTTSITSTMIYSWLEEVMDPEIPVLSLVDLGVINSVDVKNENVVVEMTPTFAGCPAIEVMKQEIVSMLQSKGVGAVTVNVSFRDLWSSDKISEKGKAALKKFGLAPPPSAQLFNDLDILEQAACPRCNGTDTVLKTFFGSTLCRSIHYCNACREGFEQFKPL